MTATTVWMLWYEEIKGNGFAEALKRASEYYHTKYGRWPNRVQLPLVWGAEAESLEDRLEGIKMEARKDVLKRHLKSVFDPQEQTG